MTSGFQSDFFLKEKIKPFVWHPFSGPLYSEERKGKAERTAHCQGHSGVRGFFAGVWPLH